MKAEELRIGNQILNMRGDMIEVCVETLIWITNYPQESNRLKPIKLTDDVLEKLSFEKQNTGYSKDHEDYGEWYEKDFPVIGLLMQSYDKEYLFGEGESTIKIKYLHELQNLIFALSGEELKLT